MRMRSAPGATAHGRARCARFRPLGLHRWAAAVATATIGVEQAALLGSVAANPRVRAHVHDSESLLLDLARSLPFRAFARAVDHWTRLADQDGSLGAHERADSCRSLSMATVGERFVLRAECGTAQGAIISQFLAQFVERELRNDLDLADEGAPLARSARQRALDALVVALEHAASSDSNTVEGQPIAVRPTTRLFPAAIRDAIRATGVECLWPGCDRPAALAEVDHLHPHARGGRSTADNAGPACHAHNRFKADRWYATRRRGVTTIRRPDGSAFTDRPPPGPG